MEHTIEINVSIYGGNTNVDAKLPFELNAIEGVKAIEGALNMLRDRMDAKARANGFAAAEDAPFEFLQDLTFRDILT